VDAERDRKRYRRALTPPELDKLVKAANSNPRPRLSKRRSMEAPSRGLLYQLAAGTGFRAKELRSLTRESFDLDAKPPTVTVQAAYSKRGRRDTQPISEALAKALRPHVEDLAAREPAFVLDWPRLAEMVRIDATAAGIKVTTAAGTLDFHALRHTYATWISSRTDAKTGQSLTRHSSAHLYLNVYAHQQDDARAKAVRSLP
jgi:integrase